MPSKLSTKPDDDFLARRYLAALAMVAVLIVIDQAVIQPPLYHLTTDAPMINIAGRQRMLSQRLTKVALELDRSETEADRRPLLAEMSTILANWTLAHDGLRSGNERLGLPGRNSLAVRSALEEIDPMVRRMSEAAARLSRTGPGPGRRLSQDRADLATILATEGEYLARMERIVGLYESEARARVVELRKTGWLVTALILLSLIGIGLFILGPAARLIRRQFALLREARDALERRVAERTIELERANRELQREVEERAMAEAQHRELLRQFSHVARTTTVGEMATGLAHELNQPLGAVANYLEGSLVALECPDPPVEDVKAALAKALGATFRAGEIIRKIRRFVNRLPSESEPFAPNRVVEEVEALLRQEAREHGIALRLNLAPELPQVVGDPVQVQQVLVNLVRNATESVTIAQPTVPSVLLETRPGESGGVEFRVTDNGEGIPPDRIDRVFDPFFSTRAEGLGMGLAISRTLIEAHHGRLSVESEPGVRTTFRFVLPPPAPSDDGTDRLHRG
jgi:two-component system, LuxR family, sensor kinase FixL